MKKLVLAVLAVCLVAGLALAQEAAAPAAKPEQVSLSGDIIDNLCAGAQKPGDLAAFVKTHTKECALMPQCVASGYSIVVDGKLSKFNKESSAKIAEFLKKADSKLQVTIVAEKAGDELNLVSIENQK